jgi:hypothetical protein
MADESKWSSGYGDPTSEALRRWPSLVVTAQRATESCGECTSVIAMYRDGGKDFGFRNFLQHPHTDADVEELLGSVCNELLRRADARSMGVAR